jgi:hypothetical protein
MRTSLLCGATVLIALSASGCLIDDTGKPRGQANVPAASVPDSGGPARRESAAKTLNDAEPEPAPSRNGDTLEVEPAPGRTPPPVE